MINYIKTESFKKLGDTLIEFSNGTNVITGANGKGKSTIFSALRFALFGTSAIAASKATIPTWGNTKAKVTLSFSDFIIVRTLTDCKVYKSIDGEVKEDSAYKVAEGNKPCTEWVKEHLGVDHKMFSIFNMSMQGDTGALITLGATELNRIVESYSGVDVLDKVMKLVNTDITVLSGQLQELVHTETDNIKLEIKELEEKLEVATKELFTLSDKRAEKKHQLSTLKEQLNDAVRNNNQHELGVQRKASLVEAIEKLEEDIAKELSVLKDYEVDVVGFDFKEAVERIDELNEQLTEYYTRSSELTSIRNKIDKLSDKVTTLTKRHEDELVYSKKRDELAKEIDKENTKLIGEMEKQSNLESELRKLKDALKGGKCSKCNRPFENFNEEETLAEIEIVASKLDKVKSKVVGLKSSKRVLTKSLSEVPNYGDDNLQEAEQLKLEISELRATETALSNEHNLFNKEEVESIIDELSQNLATYREKKKVVDRCNAKLSDLKDKLNVSQSELAKVVIPEKADTNRIAQTLSSVETSYEELVAKIARVKEEKILTEAKLRELNKELTTVETTNNLYTEKTEGLTTLKQLYTYLKKARVEFMRDVWSTILSVASDFITSTTNGWITEVGRNDNGEFTFTENGIIAPAASEASGAQKEFIGTAIRIGLSMCLNEDRALLMLDEPTAGMSEENADKLATGLLSVPGQKIIITHRSSEKLTAANVITL